MIRRWLERLRAWWHADLTRRLDDIDTRLMELRRLELIHRAIEQRPAPAATVELPPLPLPERRQWECGHWNASGVYPEDRPSECVHCHQSRVTRRD